MARDYGSRRSARRSSSAPQQFLLIVVTFLLGYLTASVVDINTLSQWMNKQVLAHHEVKKEPVKAVAQQPELPPKPKFEFYTLLANEKTPNATQSQAAGNSTNRNSINSTVTAQTTSTVAVNSAANSSKTNSLNRQSPGAVKVTEAKPVSPSQPSTSKGSYSVQVAAFKFRQDAERMKGLLTLKGFDVNVVAVTTPTKGTWFRVMIGPYANRALAQRAQINLARTEKLHGMVTGSGG